MVQSLLSTGETENRSDLVGRHHSTQSGWAFSVVPHIMENEPGGVLMQLFQQGSGKRSVKPI